MDGGGRTRRTLVKYDNTTTGGGTRIDNQNRKAEWVEREWHIFYVPITIESRAAINPGPFDLETRSMAVLASEGNKVVELRKPPIDCARTHHRC